jgi:3-(3-hydroxy-phenyl)propionate hydroxylase
MSIPGKHETECAQIVIKTYSFNEFAMVPIGERGTRRPVVIVGGGPIGLTAAIDLAQQGVPVVLIDDNNTVSVGSRGLCYAKRPLEIFDRLGCAAPMLAKGVRWKIGKIFRGEELVYRFDLLPEDGHQMPAFINLQQYYLEEYLVDRCAELAPLLQLHWKHKLVGLQDHGEYVRLAIETPDERFALEAEWVIACDGANSGIRAILGAEFKGRFFQDRFLIADVHMRADFPTERWYWFDPPFHPDQSALLHRQADGVWRIDFQLGWDADPHEERKPERVLPRLRAMLGDDADFELEWVSVYQFACRRLERFVHGRVIFAGDSAHQVSPFGARGANTGVQDADNLVWKLKLVLEGKAPRRLLESYNEERVFAADDNIGHSSRATDFITPKNPASRAFRDAVLLLAREHAFARPLINSGRLSTPTPYLQSSLNTPDGDSFAGRMFPGTNCADAPVRCRGRQDWFLRHVGGRFVALVFADEPHEPFEVNGIGCDVLCVGQDIEDCDGLLAGRYDARPGTTYLIRPDQHVAARWRIFDRAAIAAALDRATCRD